MPRLTIYSSIVISQGEEVVSHVSSSLVSVTRTRLGGIYGDTLLISASIVKRRIALHSSALRQPFTVGIVQLSVHSDRWNRKRDGCCASACAQR